jgi:hypothetical protein
MRRLVPAFAVLLIPAFSLGQKLGTKSDVVFASAPSSGIPILQMFISLAIVLGLLKFVLPKLATKLNKKLVTPLNSSIKIEESAQFAGGALYVVTARGKSLLLAVSGAGVQCLSDLTPAVAPKPEPLFMDILKEEVDQPAATFALINDQDIDRAKAQEALARLERLVG